MRGNSSSTELVLLVKLGENKVISDGNTITIIITLRFPEMPQRTTETKFGDVILRQLLISEFLYPVKP